MAAGLPGAGIGGLFYLASTIALPLRSVWRRLRGVPDTLTLRELAQQLSIAAGIVGGIWLTGWLLALALPDGVMSSVAAGGGSRLSLPRHSVIRATTVAAGFITLFVVLGGVELARFFLPARRTSLRVSDVNASPEA